MLFVFSVFTSCLCTRIVQRCRSSRAAAAPGPTVSRSGTSRPWPSSSSASAGIAEGSSGFFHGVADFGKCGMEESSESRVKPTELRFEVPNDDRVVGKS